MIKPSFEAHGFDELESNGTCVREGCMLHNDTADKWLENLIPPDELPSGGDGDPYFPGGIGCDWSGCETLWATAQSAARHTEWHQAQEDHAVDHGVSYLSSM